ncbi:PBP1A family penicillin-binding protein [Patescibacteria group bacterium]|nr:PBP1A family penicillin-binding protein [Patescibacteria group bacterium]MCL5091730.1 PBP1A family penicillin-binding protein [Patescibacteria group bacterium]
MNLLKLVSFLVDFLILVGQFTQIPFRIAFRYLKIVFKYGIMILTRLAILPFQLIRAFMHNISYKIRYFFFGFLICLLAVALEQGYQFIKSLPNPQEIGKSNYSLSTHLYDRNGKLLYEIYHDENRTPVKIDELPPYVYQATIAIEDKDFYLHKGVALTSGILRAIRDAYVNKKIQGGSTITQQLVKSALLTPERTITRKIKEVILAIWTERIYSKDQILQMYLNQVPYGGSAYGVEEAAKTYFGIHAKDLTLSQAALLAGLPQSPSIYSPYVNPDLAISRRNEVLKKMVEQGYITKDEQMQAMTSALNVMPLQSTIKAPHFVFYLKSQLEQKFGSRDIERGGYRVISTLDLNIQNEAERILKEELAKIAYLNVTNGAVLVTRPRTGEILAMVGSVDYFAENNGAFNVTTALRQPGSSIKPVMYSLALEKGYTAATVLSDTPVVFSFPGSPVYRPVNYDGVFHGDVPLRYALANSYNIPAVRVLSTIGVDNFINQARKMGISTWNDSGRYGLSLTLGGAEVTMVDMAKAYGVFANQGYRVDLNSYLKIVDPVSNTQWENRATGVKVIDDGVSYIISDILSDNFARRFEFGPNSALEIPGYKVAVKTGTTDDKKDNWTIGYTPDFLVVVWVGNNDNTPMNQYLASGVTGAAPVWNRVMSFLLKQYGNNNGWFAKPSDVVEKPCYFGKNEYFIAGTESKASCRSSLFGVTPSPTPAP